MTTVILVGLFAALLFMDVIMDILKVMATAAATAIMFAAYAIVALIPFWIILFISIYLAGRL